MIGRRLDHLDRPEDGLVEATPWRWAPLGAAGIFLLLGLAIWEPFPPGIWHDDGVYVLLGRSLAEGHGLRYFGVAGAPLAPKFPPLYPLCLALIWKIFPDFPANVSYLAGFNLFILAAGAGIFVGYLTKVLRLPVPLAFFTTLLAWLSPELWRVALIPLSEPLFLVLLLLALWAGGRAEASPGRLWILVFLVSSGLALYSRTLGVALFAGGAAAMALRSRWKAAAGTLIGFVALFLPWLAWTSRAAQTIPGPLQDTLGPYGHWWLSQVVSAPFAFISFLVASGRRVLLEIFSLLLPGVSGRGLWLGLLLLPLVLIGLREIARRTLVLPLVLILSLAILVAWPFGDVRLLVPFEPLIVAAAVLGAWKLWAWSRAKGAVGAGVVGVATAWVVLVVSVSTFRLATGWPAEPYRVRSSALMKAVTAVNEKTPETAVVGAPELWSGLQLFTGRLVVPSARFLPLNQQGPTWGTPREQYELWIAAGVTHLLVEHGGKVHGDALDRVDALCAPGTVEVLNTEPGQILVALPWDRTCQEKVLAADSTSPGG